MPEWLKKKKKDVTILEINDKTIIHEENIYYRHDEHEERRLINIIDKQLEIIGKLTTTHQRVKQVLTQTFNNNKTIIMTLSLPSNQKAPIVSSLVDADTLQPVTGTMVPKSNTSDNTDAATVDVDGNLVGVAPGTGNLTTVNTWTYTDSNTGQPVTVDLTTVTPFTITQVVTAEKVTQVVTLGTPVAQ